MQENWFTSRLRLFKRGVKLNNSPTAGTVQTLFSLSRGNPVRETKNEQRCEHRIEQNHSQDRREGRGVCLFNIPVHDRHDIEQQSTDRANATKS
eukprot:scaffold70598_cov60-Attheya_sp.AAC.3